MPASRHVRESRNHCAAEYMISHDPNRHVVRPAQHLDRDDAFFRQPARHRRHRRAPLRPLPESHGRRTSRPRGRPRCARFRLAQGGGDPDRTRAWRARDLVPEAHGPSSPAHDRACMARSAHARIPDPRAGRDGRLSPEDLSRRGPRGHRAAAAMRDIRSRRRPDWPRATRRARERRSQGSATRSWKRFATRSEFSSCRRCSRGRPDRATRTAPGPRTGTPRSRRRPASSRIGDGRSISMLRRSGSWTNAGHGMRSFTPCAFAPEDCRCSRNSTSAIAT